MQYSRTVEIMMQFTYHGLHLFKDGWLVFDLMIIILSWFSASMQVIRAFRILRASRLIMRVEEMRTIVEALINVIPRIFAVGCLQFLIFYIYAVMMTSLFKSLYDEGHLDENYFGRLDLTFFTLFQMMTLDSWSYITKQVQAVYPWAWIIFTTFVLISSFIIINLVIAVICDAVSEVHREEIESQVRRVNSEISEEKSRNEGKRVEMLEKKIDHLTKLIEKSMLQKEL